MIFRKVINTFSWKGRRPGIMQLMNVNCLEGGCLQYQIRRNKTVSWNMAGRRNSMHGFGRMVCLYHGLLDRDVLSAVLYWVYEVSQGVSLVNKMQHNWEHVPTYRSMVCIKLRIWLKITFFCLATTDPTTGLIVHKSLNNEGKYWTFMQCVILKSPFFNLYMKYIDRKISNSRIYYVNQ